MPVLSVNRGWLTFAVNGPKRFSCGIPAESSTLWLPPGVVAYPSGPVALALTVQAPSADAEVEKTRHLDDPDSEIIERAVALKIVSGRQLFVMDGDCATRRSAPRAVARAATLPRRGPRVRRRPSEVGRT